MNPTNVGLIKDGENRPAMDWLEQYFKEHWFDANNLWYGTDIPRNPIEFIEVLDSLDTLDSLIVDEPIVVGGNLRLVPSSLQNYEVFDLRGARLGTISANGINDAVGMLRNSNVVKASGIYYLRSRATGKMQPVRVVK